MTARSNPKPAAHRRNTSSLPASRQKARSDGGNPSSPLPVGKGGYRLTDGDDKARTLPANPKKPARPQATTPSGDTFDALMAVVTRLCGPGGCPWDREQTHASLRQHLLEETYETLEAIESGDPAKLAEELGDLLTHIAFHTDIARRNGEFTTQTLFSALIAKLVRRHPHVFGDMKLDTAGEVAGQWETIKKKEGGRDSVVDSIPSGMPALAFAATLQRRASKAGLTWDGEPDFASLKDESAEQKEARAGAYLWAVVQRLHSEGVDPETALRAVALRFRDRVKRAERLANPGSPGLAGVPARKLARLWKQTGAG